MACTLVLTVCLALGGDGKATADELVRRLGDKSFQVRDRAARELLARGTSAVDALKRGQQDADAEIRERCRRLLEQIQTRLLEERLRIFLSDRKSRPDPILPAAERFVTLAGSSKGARELYGEVLREHRTALEALAGDPKLASERLKSLAKTVQERSRTTFGRRRTVEVEVTRAELAMILLASADSKLTLESMTVFHRGTVLRSVALAEALTKEDDPLRRMFLGWLERERDAATVALGLEIAENVPMKEALPLAVKIARDAGSPSVQATALLSVARLGDKTHVKEIARLLDRKAVLTTVTFGTERRSTTVELGDVALAVSITLASQDPQEFGFDIRRPQEARSYNYYGFPGPAERAAAHARWRKAEK